MLGFTAFNPTYWLINLSIRGVDPVPEGGLFVNNASNKKAPLYQQAGAFTHY
jgi:hypothetical protein